MLVYNNGRHLILFETINHFLVEQVLWVEMFSLFGFTALFEIFMWPRHRSTLRTNKKKLTEKFDCLNIKSLIIKSRSYFDRKTQWMYVRTNDIFWVDITSHCCKYKKKVVSDYLQNMKRQLDFLKRTKKLLVCWHRIHLKVLYTWMPLVHSYKPIK